MAGRSIVAGAVALALALVCACASPAAAPTGASVSPSASSAGVLRYVALGDSYTIGTSVAEAERWPNQLVMRLGSTPPSLQLVANLGVNGRTSGDVIRDQLPQLGGLRADFVSLLIGVNDVVQGVSAERYRTNVAAILDALLGRLPPDRILAVSTPDYTVTPAGADYGDPSQQSAGIQANNRILAELAKARGIPFVDIYDLSLRAASDGALVAGDGLHPSGAQYALWVERITPVVAEVLGRPAP
ncbi:MAG: SGNH/GDSL hydrolase family protein [Candidatus Limnocylindrales bacterium]